MSHFDLANDVISICTKKSLKIATIESCTGGLLAGSLTAIAGSSLVFERGFVTYSNEAKEQMVGVPADMISQYGAVSEEVARAMAIGGLTASLADIAISITGIAGPGGGSLDKPVGTVCFGVATKEKCTVLTRNFPDHGRDAIRDISVEQALKLILDTALHC